MKDYFDEVMDRIMQPISDLKMGALDTTYLMRQDG
jgi:hypothetical protein